MADSPPRRVVITGVGVLSPIGSDLEAYWQSLLAGRSGVRSIQALDVSALPVRISPPELPGFDAKKIITGKEERKSLKMMARSVQMGVASAKLAFADTGRTDRLPPRKLHAALASNLARPDPDGIGRHRRRRRTVRDRRTWRSGHGEVEAVGHPRNPAALDGFKYLPNMVACHVSIFLDAQGPNNSITETDAAGLLALGEAARILRRDGADLFLVGAADSKINPLSLVRQCSCSATVVAQPCRNCCRRRANKPFGTRDAMAGLIGFEGAGVLAVGRTWITLRPRRLASTRRIGRLRARPSTAAVTQRAGLSFSPALIRAALRRAGIGPDAIDHVNAHGQSTIDGDVWEARGLAEVFAGLNTPVFAAKSYFGSLSAANGAPVELIGSLLALETTARCRRR